MNAIVHVDRYVFFSLSTFEHTPHIGFRIQPKLIAGDAFVRFCEQKIRTLSVCNSLRLFVANLCASIEKVSLKIYIHEL
jgi:hypothetical protein